MILTFESDLLGSLASLLAVPVRTHRYDLSGLVDEIGCGNRRLVSELHLLKGACSQKKLVRLEPLKHCLGGSCGTTYCLWRWCSDAQETPFVILL
jgi:hypothetical protein